MKRSFFIILAFYALDVFAAPERPPARVETYIAANQDVYNPIHAVGIIKSKNSIYLTAQNSGNIEKIFVEDGGIVKAGDILATIDDKKAQSELDIAKADYNLAELKLDRNSKTLKAAASSKSDYDQAMANFAQAKAKLEKAKDNLDKTKIIAPCDGKIGFKLKNQYEQVNMGDKIFRLDQSNPLEIEFKLPQRYLNIVKSGDAVQYKIGKNLESAGHVSSISTVLDPEDESFSLRAIVANPDDKIIPGSFASIDVMADKHSAITIPQQAIVQTDKGSVVYLLKDGVVNISPVTKGQIFEDLVEINSGVSLGDQVISSGQMKLFPGMKAIAITNEAAK